MSAFDRAYLLAGGLGTRVRSVSPGTPKALLPINGRPFIYYVFDLLRARGIRHTVLLTGYLHERIRECVADGAGAGISVAYSHEKTPLGTGGALRNALPHMPEFPVLVMNGDTLLDVDLDQMLAVHCSASVVATIAVVQTPDASASGRVTMDTRDRISYFSEKASRSAGWANAGVYILEESVIASIPPGENVSLERTVFPQLVLDTQVVQAYRHEGVFGDMGTADGLLKVKAIIDRRALEFCV